MHLFTCCDVDENDVFEVTFDKVPTKAEIEDLILNVDLRQHEKEISDLMKADGEDIYFSACNEEYIDGEDYVEGYYATLKYLED